MLLDSIANCGSGSGSALASSAQDFPRAEKLVDIEVTVLLERERKQGAGVHCNTNGCH
jgi:hypothetical protein